MGVQSSSPAAPPPADPVTLDESFPRGLTAGYCVGPWRILRWLGEGGYGVVYLAEDTRAVVDGGVTGLVAVKLAMGRTRDEEPQARRRLLREAESLSRVAHPQVVRCLEVGEHQGVPFLVLEYVPGPKLYDWSALRNRTAREVVGPVATLALALQAVHAAGVFHRDLKGENVLIRESDEQPVLLDFGVGDYDGASTLTETVLPPGTAHYRSAEAVRFLLETPERSGARYRFTLADELYALGVLLYRLLTDEYPFSPELPRDLLYERILEVEPPAPVVLNPRVPRSISDLAMRLLSKTPEARGESAGAVHEAIRAALADGSSQWEELLFEWDDGPSVYSRTTEETSLPGPMAPGHEAGLMHAAARKRHYVWEQRKKRALRKRPRQPEPRPPEPSAPARPQPGRRSGTKVAWALLAVACLATLLWFVRDRESSRVAFPVSPTKEGESMKTEKRSGARSREEEVAGATSGGVHLLERCAAAAAAGLVLSACAGVPARPSQRKCPPEAISAMDKRGFDEDEPLLVRVDVNQPGEVDEIATIQDGPIVSRLDEELHGFPEGTLLYGYLWTGGEQIFGQYDRVKFPSGEVIPVCIELGTEGARGFPKLLGSKAPGTVEIPRKVPAIAVKRFDYKDDD
ncbi:MAG TPA: serine/threonine-protein kinase [Archangium sp.]|nr:serine/threonine-protein kinase [Archangium sp.]